MHNYYLIHNRVGHIGGNKMANVDHAKIEEAVKMILEAVGEDPTVKDYLILQNV